MMLFSIKEEKRKMSDIEQDFHEWRASGIGSSDAKTVMHGDAKAWAELKRIKEGGTEKPRGKPMDRLAALGRLVETQAMDWFEEDTPEARPVERQCRSRILRGDGDYLLATLDGVSADGYPVETKFSFEPNKTIEEIADRHNPQLQHQMIVLGVGFAYLAVVSASWGKFSVVTVAADKEWQSKYLARCDEFFDYWKRGSSITGVAPVQQMANIVKLRDHVWPADDNEIADVAVPWLEAKLASEQLDLRRGALIAKFPDDAKSAKWTRGGSGVIMKRDKRGVVSVSAI